MSRPGAGGVGEASSSRAEVLGRLGLGPRAAWVYAHLCEHGAEKAAAIARATKIRRAVVHRALHDLVEGGFAVADPTNPARFVAVDPDELFARALEQSRRRLAAIEDARAVAAASWAAAAIARDAGREATFRLVEGKSEIEATARRMTDHAARSIVALDTRPRLRSGDAVLVHGARPRRGDVDVRILEGEAARAPEGAASTCFLVVDANESLLLDAQRGATWTDSPPLVAMANALHASLWARMAAEVSIRVADGSARPAARGGLADEGAPRRR